MQMEFLEIVERLLSNFALIGPATVDQCPLLFLRSGHSMKYLLFALPNRSTRTK